MHAADPRVTRRSGIAVSLIEDTAVDAYDGHVDPYEAGVGTIVNCDAATCRVPVGMTWTDPLGVQFHAMPPGFDGVNVAELTARTGAVAA
jgi:hypothetical protein